MAQITLNSSGVASSGSLLLQTNGTTTQATVDTSGNLGLGVTPSAWNSGWKAFQNTGGAVYSNSGNQRIGYNAYLDSGGTFKYIANGYATDYQQGAGNGSHVWYTAGSGTAGNTITFTQAMTLDASGNLGIGTTSPSTRLHVAGGAGTEVRVTSSASLADGTGSAIVRFGGSNSATSGYVGYGGTANDYYAWNALSGNMIFGTANLERARIDSSGNLLVGATATDSGAKTRIVYGSGANGLQIKDSADTSNTAFVIFQNGSNSNIGTISRVGTTNVVAYNTTSDERLKNDLGVATTDSVIDALVIHDFTWKTDGTVDRGVFAQEAALVKPLAVREGSDEVDENGVPKNPWGVDYSKFVPDLIVYVKQLKQQIQSLETRLEALENK